jgi:hypothetical protein
MTRRVWVALVTVFITCLAMNVGSLIYANNVARRSAQQWCSVVITIDDSYKDVPPQTPVGKKLAGEMHELRTKLECKE